MRGPKALPRMPRRRAGLLVAALLLPLAAPAPATAARRALGVAVGVRLDAVREDLLVPMTFTGPGTRLAVSYRDAAVGGGLLVFRLDLGLGVLFNRWGDPAATLDYGAEVRWERPVVETGGWRFSAGPRLALDSRVNYLFSWDSAHGYWLGSQWLGPSATARGPLGGGWRLEASAGLALVGFVGRPPPYRFEKQDALKSVSFYAARPNEREELVTVDELQVLRIEVALRAAPKGGADEAHGVASGWSFGADGRLARVATPRSQLNVGVFLYAARSFAW